MTASVNMWAVIDRDGIFPRSIRGTEDLAIDAYLVEYPQLSWRDHEAFGARVVRVAVTEI